MLTVSTETIKRMERAGLLKSIRFNSRLIRYRREDVETMIAGASASTIKNPPVKPVSARPKGWARSS